MLEQSDMNEALEVAYDAGFIDGEGCITITRSWNKSREGRTTWSLVVAIEGSDLESLERLQSRYGGYIYTADMKKRNAKLAADVLLQNRVRQMYHLHLSAQRAKHVLETIAPYVRVKRKQLELALAFQESLDGKPITAKEAVNRDALCVAIWSLNRPAVDHLKKIRDNPPKIVERRLA
jgi:hypothetical protein